MRATATWTAVVAALLAGSSALGGSAAYAFPGMLVVSAATMSLTMNLTDRQRMVALTLAAVSAAAGIALGTAVADRPAFESVVFLGLCVATLGAFVLGTAAVVVALAAIVAFYAATLVTASWATFVGNAGSAVAGAVLSAVLLTVVMVDKPAAGARRLLHSVRAASARLAGAPPKQHGRRVADLLAAISAARAHVALYPELWPDSLRCDHAAALREVAIAAEAGHELPHLGAASWPQPTAKIRTRNWVEPGDPGGRPLMSMAAQLLTAAILALGAAQLLYPRYWFWAVLAALVMLFGTTSAADAVGKGLRRVAGTAAALPLGIVLAQAVGHDLAAVAALVVVVMFLQSYYADVSYGVSVFFLTLLMSLLISATGAQTADALKARLLLTALGAAIGVGVALFVLPTRTRTLLRGRAVAALESAAETLTALVEGAPAMAVEDHACTTERRLDLLRSEAVAAQKGWPLSTRHERTRCQVDAGIEATRALHALALQYRVAPDRSPSALREAGHVLSLLEEARAQLSGAPGRRPRSPGSHTRPPGPVSDEPADALTRHLQRLRLSMHELTQQVAE